MQRERERTYVSNSTIFIWYVLSDANDIRVVGLVHIGVNHVYVKMANFTSEVNSRFLIRTLFKTYVKMLVGPDSEKYR